MVQMLSLNSSIDWETLLLSTVPLGLLIIVTALGMVDFGGSYSSSLGDISLTENFDMAGLTNTQKIIITENVAITDTVSVSVNTSK